MPVANFLKIKRLSNKIISFNTTTELLPVCQSILLNLEITNIIRYVHLQTALWSCTHQHIDWSGILSSAQISSSSYQCRSRPRLRIQFLVIWSIYFQNNARNAQMLQSTMTIGVFSLRAPEVMPKLFPFGARRMKKRVHAAPDFLNILITWLCTRYWKKCEQFSHGTAGEWNILHAILLWN